MSIVITGANGSVGTDLVKKLSIKHKVFAIYRRKNIEVKNLPNVKWIKHDLKNEIKTVFRPKPQIIIHCAVDQKPSKTKNIHKYIQSNFIILQNILKFAKKNSAKLIVNFSSIEAYGKIGVNFLNENYYEQNRNTYGTTKFISEKFLLLDKVNFINLRLPGILCEPKNKNFKRPWLSKIINRISNNDNIKVHNINTKFNNITSTEEIAGFIEYLLKNTVSIRDTFNFVSQKPIILKEVFQIAKKKLKSRSKIISITNNEKESFYISARKLEQKLKYKTQSTKNILIKYLNNFAEYKKSL